MKLAMTGKGGVGKTIISALIANSLNAEGRSVVAIDADPDSNLLACLPGGAPTKLKLVFEKNTGVLLGGQVRGNASAGEIINIVSACIQKRMLAEDIATFQMGTHPALTASPTAYPLVNAAEIAISQVYKMRA